MNRTLVNEPLAPPACLLHVDSSLGPQLSGAFIKLLLDLASPLRDVLSQVIGFIEENASAFFRYINKLPCPALCALRD
jgi:hypothetical protein